MTQDCDLERIKQLVLKQLTSQLNEQEAEELRTLCAANAHYRALVERILSPRFLEEAAKSSHHDCENDWSRLRKAGHIRMPLRYTLQRAMQHWPYAAAVLILGAFAITGIWRDKARHTLSKETPTMEAFVYIDGLDQPEKIYGEYDFATICQELKQKTGDKIAALRTQYVRVVVPEGKSYKLRLTDGTWIYMKEGSFLSVPANFSNSNRRINFAGDAHMDISNAEHEQFYVYTGRGDILASQGQLDINCIAGGRRVEVMVNGGNASVVTSQGTIALSELHKAMVDENEHITVQASNCTNPQSRWRTTSAAEQWMAVAPNPLDYIK